MKPDEYFRFHNHMSTRFVVTFLEDKVVRSGMQSLVLHSPDIGHLGDTKMISASSFLWRPSIREDILDKIKNITACINLGEKLKTQFLETKNINNGCKRATWIITTRFYRQNSQQENNQKPGNFSSHISLQQKAVNKNMYTYRNKTGNFFHTIILFFKEYQKHLLRK